MGMDPPACYMSHLGVQHLIVANRYTIESDPTRREPRDYDKLVCLHLPDTRIVESNSLSSGVHSSSLLLSIVFQRRPLGFTL